ncbi:unnamed protein product [Blepharisma stoltei]|uniref:Bromo domain-containing protein n=1 Tax=Blepharisma stoltei TaxID=1481888 RepID=A0AAU9JUM7_9CILI|nr:unnamed protein product [Blepharisma stoltei]
METKLFLTADEETKAYQMLNLLELHDESADFLHPVDWKLLAIPDYPLQIKNPMDLGSIKKKIKSKAYHNLSDFIADVQLVWNNCKTYNESHTDVYQQAEFLEKQMRRYCTKLKIPVPRGQAKHLRDEEEIVREDPNVVSFEEKWEMTEQIKKLGQSTLEEIVQLITTNAPHAVENEEQEKIKVKLDEVDRDTFTKMQEIIVRSFTVDEGAPHKKAKRS